MATNFHSTALQKFCTLFSTVFFILHILTCAYWYAQSKSPVNSVTVNVCVCDCACDCVCTYLLVCTAKEPSILCNRVCDCVCDCV